MCMEFYYVVALHWEKHHQKKTDSVDIHIMIYQVIVC